MPDFKSAFDNYNNKLSESNNKFSIAGLKNKITDAVNEMSNKNIAGLNELGASGGLGALGKNLLDKLASAAKDFAKNAVSMVTDMAKDALNQAINAGIAFVGNIVEDLISNIEKAIYLPDELVLTTLKGSYEVGADLAYHDHTIREFALTHDLVKTLEWVDEQYCDKGYPIKYNSSYADLQRDLDIVAKNSCWKNLKYMYKSMYKERNDNIIERDSEETYINTYFGTSEAKQAQPKIFAEHDDTYKAYKDKVNTIERLMVQYFRILITYSYTYVNVSAVKEFFDAFPDVLVPKYYGITDDKYGKAFNFSASNMNVMMPFFKQHEKSATDEFVSEFALINDSKVSGNIAYENSVNGNNSKLNEFRENVYNKQSEKGASLMQTAFKGGSSGVIEEIEDQYYQNADGIVVKKNDKVVRNGIASFLEEPQYITQRNKNIKAIYSYLSSDVIFADKKMVNQTFYERCKYKTDDILTDSLSKAKGILGSSHLVQSIFEIGDFLDSTGYKFIMSSADYIFNPKDNVALKNFGDNYSDTISNFSSLDDITKYLEEAQQNSEYAENMSGGTTGNTTGTTTGGSSGNTGNTDGSSGSTGDTTGSTQGSYSDPSRINDNVTRIEEEIVSNDTIRAKLESVFRFIDEIPLVQQRNIILKYFNFFYNEMTKSNVPEKFISDTCSKMMNYVFGSPGHKDFTNLARLMDSMDVRYIKTCLRIIIGLYYLNNLIDELKLYNNYKNVINKEFRLSMSMMIREVQSTGFTKTIYQYDQHFLQSLTKQTYYKALDDMRTLSDKTTRKDHMLLSKLDNMTRTFIGFNRGGIMGWDDVSQKIKYTDYDIGDYYDVKCTKNGTFVSGATLSNSVGILKYEYPEDKFTKTNITSGSFDIYDFNNGTFFKNVDTGEILYWNGTYCVSKLSFINYETGKDFELKQLPNDLIICVSSTNNGLYYWNNTTKNFVNVDNIGGQYSWYSIKNGLLMFSKSNSTAGVYVANTEKIEKVNGLTGNFSSFVDYESRVTATGTYQPPTPPTTDGSTPQQPPAQSISAICNVYNIVLSRQTKGLVRIYTISDTTIYDIKFNYVAPEDPQKEQYHDERLLFAPPTNSGSSASCYIIHDRKDIPPTQYNEYLDTIEYHYFKTQFTVTIAGQLPGSTFKASTYINYDDFKDVFESSTSGSIIKTSNKKTDGLTLNYLTDSGLFFIFDNIWYYYNDRLRATVKFPDGTTRPVSDYKFIDFNNKVFCTSDTEILYFSESFYSSYYNHITINHVLDEKDRVKGWKFDTIKCKTSEYNTKYLEYLTNTETPIGSRFYNTSTNKAININLNSGYWKIYFANSKFIAVAYNSCNDGIRKANYSMTPLFNEINDAVNFGSYSNGDYDYKSKRLYLCSNRENTIWNIDKIPYDIDEFIYPLDEYYMQKIVINHNEQSMSDLIDIMESKYDNDEVYINNDIVNQYDDNGDEVGGGTGSGNGDGSGSGDGNNTGGDNQGGSGNGSSAVPEGKYTLDDLLKLLNEFLSSFDSYMSEVTASSGIFAEIFTYAETAMNFDPDDEKSMQNLQAALLMLYSLDDNGNINDGTVNGGNFSGDKVTFSSILSRYKAYIRKLFIVNNTTSSGEVIKENTNTEEWNIKYNYASEDFLDSDETSESYYFKEKSDAVEYVQLDTSRFDEDNSDAFISKRYGIALYYRLLKYNRISDFAYFKTDFDTEYKYFVNSGKYRDLYVKKSDLDIVKKYPQNVLI